MRQISLHDVHKATKANIGAWLPFQIVSDGEVIATVIPAYDVHKLGDKAKAKHDVHKGNELKFSKSRQSQGMLRVSRGDRRGANILSL